MPKFRTLLITLAAAFLSACATTTHPTYSGDLRAALEQGAERVKDAGRTAGDYVRNGFGTHVELNEAPAATKPEAHSATARSAVAPTAVETSAVELYSVSPTETSSGAALTLERHK
jgi:hypothetical protein